MKPIVGAVDGGDERGLRKPSSIVRDRQRVDLAHVLRPEELQNLPCFRFVENELVIGDVGYSNENLAHRSVLL